MRLLPNSCFIYVFCGKIWIVDKQVRDKDDLLYSLQKTLKYMIRGSIVELRSKCGKTNCACSRDPAKKHIRYYLSFSDAGRTRMTYIPKNRLKAIEKGLLFWKQHKELSKKLAEINLEEALQENSR